MKILQELFENNFKWSEDIKHKDPNFFPSLAKGQSPKYMWIGCSDSRVAAEKIVNLAPGEMFVHRNIANVINPNDTNCLSGVEFAIHGLNIKHFIICGHYDCGGIRAAEREVNHTPELEPNSLINYWLGPLKSAIYLNKDFLEQFQGEEKIRVLCELNVNHQVENLKNTDIMKRAMAKDKQIRIYGVIYDIQNGRLKEVKSILN